MTCAHCLELEEENARLRRFSGLLANERTALSLTQAFRLTAYGGKILAALYHARGRCLSRDFLGEVAPATWRSDFQKGLHVQICRIRHAVGAAAIVTYPGAGYAITDLGRLLCEEALEARARAA